MATEQFFGPVDYLVFAFDQGTDLSGGLTALLEQVDRGGIEILDIELITRDDTTGDAVTHALSSSDLAVTVDLGVFEGVESSILDTEDLAAVVSELGDGQFALVIIYEDRSLATAAHAWTGVGGREIFAGGIALTDLENTLQEEASA